MPPKSNPPPVMTWGKASLVLLLAVFFDIARAFFQFFWLFGPALAAAICSYWSGGSLISTVGCSVAASGAGVLGAGPLAAFGVMMSMAVGFAGFLVLGITILFSNPRLLQEKSGALWLAGSFALGEIPFIGAIPSFTLTLIRLYRAQIRSDKEKLKKFQEETRAQQVRTQQLQLARLQYVAREIGAANDAIDYEQRGAA